MSALRVVRLAFLFGIALPFPSVAEEAQPLNWPQYRGAESDGLAGTFEPGCPSLASPFSPSAD